MLKHSFVLCVHFFLKVDLGLCSRCFKGSLQPNCCLSNRQKESYQYQQNNRLEKASQVFSLSRLKETREIFISLSLINIAVLWLFSCLFVSDINIHYPSIIHIQAIALFKRNMAWRKDSKQRVSEYSVVGSAGSSTVCMEKHHHPHCHPQILCKRRKSLCAVQTLIKSENHIRQEPTIASNDYILEHFLFFSKSRSRVSINNPLEQD